MVSQSVFFFTKGTPDARPATNAEVSHFKGIQKEKKYTEKKSYLVDEILILLSAGFTEAQVLEMPLDKFRMYLKAIEFKSVSNRASYIYDIVAVIAGLFGKKDNKIIENQLKSLDM